MANLLASFTPGPDRNNYSGWVGFRFTPTVNMPITSLGIHTTTGDTGTRSVFVYSGATVISSATIALGGTVGTYYYAAASGTLNAGTTYDICAQVTSGGQFWSDLGNVSLNSASGVIAIFGSPGGFSTWTSNQGYVGFDLVYGAAPPPVPYNAPPPMAPGIYNSWPVVGPQPPEDDTTNVVRRLWRTSPLVPQSGLKLAQEIIEAVGTNPAAKLSISQELIEAVGANPAGKLNIAQLYIELVASTFVPPYRGPKVDTLQQLAATPEDVGTWLAQATRRYVPPPALVLRPPRLAQLEDARHEDRAPWQTPRPHWVTLAPTVVPRRFHPAEATREDVTPWLAVHAHRFVPVLPIRPRAVPTPNTVPAEYPAWSPMGSRAFAAVPPAFAQLWVNT